MVHSPNDALQTHKVSRQNPSRGRVGGQKSLKNPENLEKLSPGRGRGGGYWGGRPLWTNSAYLRQHRRVPGKASERALPRTGAERGHKAREPHGHRATAITSQRTTEPRGQRATKRNQKLSKSSNQETQETSLVLV